MWQGPAFFSITHALCNPMNENPIIKSFEAMPPGDIYLLGPRAYVERGFDYYKKGRVEGFEWNRGGETLLARIRGTRMYTVSLRLEAGRLNYYCSCPAWSSSANCKHVICVLATIKNILNEKHFQDRRISPAYRESLRDLLLFPGKKDKQEKKVRKKTKAEPQNYSIVLEKSDSYWRLPARVYKGEREISGGRGALPKALQPLVESTGYYFYSRYDSKDLLLDYLKEHGNRYPLFLKLGNKKIPLKWEEGLTFIPKIELAVANDKVTARLVYMHNDVRCARPYRLSDSIVIDLEKSRIGLLEDTEGLKMWRNIRYKLQPFENDTDDSFFGADDDIIEEMAEEGADDAEGAMSIPLERFGNIQLQLDGNCNAWLDHIIFKAGGKEASPEWRDYSCRIMIDAAEGSDSKLVLRALCDFGGTCYGTTTPFFEFLPMMESGMYDLSQPLKAKKRRNVMIDAFIRLLTACTKKERDKIIKNALANGDFRKRSVRSEAKHRLEYAFSALSDESSRLQLKSGGWSISRSEREREAHLYIVLYELFGVEVFRNMKNHFEMSLEVGKLYASLHLLYEKLKSKDIPLYFKGKPVESAKWDFTFDAARKTEIDWFEIKPEIRCDDRLVDDEAWQIALNRKGVVESEETIQVLDANTREILSAIGRISRNREEDDKSREREIVRVPRLQILDWIDLRKKGVRVKLPEDDEKLIEHLTSFERMEKKTLPEKLKAKLRPYQKEGYYWLSFLYEHRFGACLADDMGLGKTLQAITLLAGIKEGKVEGHGGDDDAPHLVVLPPSLLFNWQNEIEKFYPSLRVHCYVGTERVDDFEGYDVVLTTYGLIRRDIEKLEEVSFNVIIFDEAQAVKNIYAATTGAVRRLKGRFKLVITGTPLENHLGEYFSSLDLALPGLLGDYDEFKKYLKAERSADLDIIVRRTRPFVLRRTKEKILKELPPKTENDVYLELTEKQKALYKKTVEMIRATIDDAYRSKTSQQAQIIALTAILKLRQLCVSPRLLDPTVKERSPKIEFLSSKIDELVDEGHSALVFSQFTSFLDILEEELVREGIPHFRLDGSTPTPKRKRLVEGFQNGERPSVFLLSLKAGGQGLNLTRASYVFHLDPWWNPAVENQASDRAHRIGQKNKVTVTRILMHHTIEEKMMTLKKKKLALFNAIMDDSARGRKGFSISKEDFEFLIG